LHENDVQDQGYRRFLSRLITPLLEKLDPNQKGIGFGCGPGPALSAMLEERGHRVDLYDPFYYNHLSVFHENYDFICATEVVEHLRDPHKDFIALFKMLKTGGWLGIMTKLVIDKPAFSQWHYIRDMTISVFTVAAPLNTSPQRFNAALYFAENDVIFLNKN